MALRERERESWRKLHWANREKVAWKVKSLAITTEV